MGSLAKLAGAGAVVALVIALAGLLLARAWYRDDACTTEDWKCDLGGTGLALAIYAGLALVPLLAILGAVAATSAARRRSDRREPPRDEPDA